MKSLQITAQEKGIYKLSLLTSAILGALLLSACGGGGGDSSTSTPVTPPPPPPPPDTPPSVSVDSRIIVSVGDSVSFSASASDPDGDDISYEWVQQSGEPVSNSSGFDTATASFSAPDSVSSFTFEVTATANGQSDSASILVIVLEDVDTAVFIDAQFTGASDGSIDAPYKEFASVLEQNLDDNTDVDFYIKTPTDDTVFSLWEGDTRTISQNISFYGGYLEDWHRDATNQRTPIMTENEAGIRYSSTDQYVEVSGIDLMLNLDAVDNGTSVVGIQGVSLDHLMIRDNTISLSDYPFDNSSASVYGVISDQITSFSLLNNTITSGSAPASARDAVQNNRGAGADGRNGSNGDGADGGIGGDSDTGISGGGQGGDGGRGSSEDGERGEDSRLGFSTGPGAGGAGGDASEDEDDGVNGVNGNNGITGSAGNGGTGFGRFTNGGRFATSSGSLGRSGSDGAGGGGGGGGGSSTLGFNGGGGGGGGEGGEGGEGGFGANSGGASIGVYVIQGALNDIAGNTITTSNGGIGGIGGLGASGGDGGSGGSGADGNSSNSGDGGNGGNGGDGGDGGIGGSGGGGPTFGILLNSDTFATISNNQITTGNGGNGGSAIIAIEQAAGKGGWSIGIFDANTEDASTPTLDGNTFTIGEAGDDGNPSAGTGTAADTNF
ncbi:PKD domain-containing protein [Aliiglaciecola sp. M165]|uniref:PKD domain-containing protein n=1 Tax=Aliiglaciecola sp. M165 TaxID=2593649 RepID=UPI00117CBE10|nr:hypothetical protein [Aliiglaciecola sp. M165]TRY34019.1 hypothetical protein FM019_01815 [Aliiglaciecola sp. M165]